MKPYTSSTGLCTYNLTITRSQGRIAFKDTFARARVEIHLSKEIADEVILQLPGGQRKQKLQYESLQEKFINCGKMKVGLQAFISCRAEGSEQGENPPEKGKGVLLEERPAESYNGSSTTKDQQWQQVKPKRRNRKETGDPDSRVKASQKCFVADLSKQPACNQAVNSFEELHNDQEEGDIIYVEELQSSLHDSTDHLATSESFPMSLIPIDNGKPKPSASLSILILANNPPPGPTIIGASSTLQPTQHPISTVTEPSLPMELPTFVSPSPSKEI
ncbi:hypothetical protein MRB53_033536 [Persea americana]|uniref:Uncharacterized protein n=1 Tax=Persea americana TaxID=3435 RepID=A0ACC2KV17_PERAE|nr:hypothetical protein MRB53_033536 [Persea americana]